MANFKFDTPEEKKRLQERAQALKPKAANVVATAQGWAQSRPNGTLELLVSFRGLDELLGDAVSEVVLVGEPITFVPEVVTEEVKVEEVKEEPKVEEPKPAPKKPGPKKKAAE